MTLNQKILEAYEKSFITTTIRKKNAAKVFSVDRRLLSYLNTIMASCDSVIAEVVKEAIRKNEKFTFDSGETTRSLEAAASLVNSGRKLVGYGDKSMVLYLLRCDGKTKIGIAKNISRRVSSMQTGNPYKIELIKEYRLGSEALAREVEKYLHNTYKTVALVGEWFTLEDNDLKTIDEYVTQQVVTTSYIKLPN